MTVGKVILVTGASSGIGRACAQLLHGQGHCVYGASRTPERTSAPFKMLQLDVTSDEGVALAVATIIAEQGRIDVLVNNAGTVYAGSVEDTSIAEAQAQFDTNFFGALRLCKAVAPHMRAQKSGLMINVSSLAGLLGMPFQGLYSASKFALEGLSESLRMEVAGFGIDVVLLEPGDIATSVVENRIRTAASGEGSAYHAQFEEILALYERDEKAGAAPQSVAHRVAALIGMRHPSVRYGAGPLVQRFLTGLKRVVPACLFERGLMYFYGLKRR